MLNSRMEEFIYSVVRTELGQLNYVEVVNDENSSRGSLNDHITKHVNEFLEKVIMELKLWMYV